MARKLIALAFLFAAVAAVFAADSPSASPTAAPTTSVAATPTIATAPTTSTTAAPTNSPAEAPVDEISSPPAPASASAPGPDAGVADDVPAPAPKANGATVLKGVSFASAVAATGFLLL